MRGSPPLQPAPSCAVWLDKSKPECTAATSVLGGFGDEDRHDGAVLDVPEETRRRTLEFDRALPPRPRLAPIQGAVETTEIDLLPIRKSPQLPRSVAGSSRKLRRKGD